VFRFLKKKQVPIGIFYRDVYWKFDELYPLKGIKKKIMQMIYHLEEKFYEKYVDVIFLPSLEMGKYVGIDLPKYALPPGGKELVPKKAETQKERFHAIYVGGLKHPDYGLPLMLDTLEKMKQLEIPVDFTIVCREEEYAGIPENVKERIRALGIDVQHKSGNELEQLYKRMDFALIPRAKTRYNDFSVPMKLVDYLSHRLPIVATNCSAQEEMIESGPYGVICEANPDSMLQAIEKMKENLSIYQKNIEETFLQKHSWIARVEEVKRILLKEEQ
jgi:glycosyltransferase involved in cell wall biosynthesis